MSLLVIDVGTSGLRAATVRADGSLGEVRYRANPPQTPFPGLVEFDAELLASLAIEAATEVIDAAGEPIEALGISAQRASTVLWDRPTGVPLGPALGWQDLRTVLQCITAKSEHGLTLAPNQSATKLAWLLDTYRADRRGDLCFGTVETWLAWRLTGGEAHVTDPSNAAVTGLLLADASGWNQRALDALNIPTEVLPTIVDTSGFCGVARLLPGAPPLAALVGDQQASLVGQSCVAPGSTKITFGTGGMLDTCRAGGAPASARRSPHGTFPIVAWRHDGQLTWGVEAIMLSAGSNVEWLVDDLQILDTPADSHRVASQVASTDGVVYVPALLGLGTPHWDYGARGTLLGVTRGSGRAHLARAVLEGVAHRGADLIEAAIADLQQPIETVRIDGGMSENPTFVQALADASGCVVEVSPHKEATTMGAAYLAGIATGRWSFADLASLWSPRQVVEPAARLDREQWRRAIERSQRWIPELSALDF